MEGHCEQGTATGESGVGEAEGRRRDWGVAAVALVFAAGAVVTWLRSEVPADPPKPKDPPSAAKPR